ncbi:hypothetical protein SERLA73DRAFT_145072 [Serpula lacrymans var. lacrymans S7.3]|uniref:DUF6699 domain-containing protein n=2 Tax=Serpula lacrymans var. lacrymans TaxID=341189 RepID=F8QCY3_SERL3|nr:uncharacterized protein SERLADRAFT_402870 [Serpula lacrymans var. lacrymans S7.9]EGN93998.1 hypothetical protein SERLA73DRAFT_145072 [Serpula lacrymans var. lacrymans S7.3]EGO19358.1 hypothetical protein SERLADRAFT_402870 [Serpula lacrymans var. lacrymans S7.9]
MHFDIAFPIDLIRFNSTYPPRYLNAKDLDKPAADVTITKMVIQCPFKTDWEVYVSRTDGIRCRDVFDAIYASFNTVLTPLERQSIPLKDRKSYEEACKLRCKATHGLTAVEEAQGLKRVDVLLHNTVFQGLTQPKSGGDWVLNLGRSA